MDEVRKKRRWKVEKEATGYSQDKRETEKVKGKNEDLKSGESLHLETLFLLLFLLLVVPGLQG